MLQKKVKKRASLLAAFLLISVLAIFFILKSLDKNILYFKSPTDIKASQDIDFTKKVRVGGMVKKDSVIISDEEINQQMQQMESMLKPQLAQQMVYVSYYMYEELSDEDINAYAKFYDKALGQKELKVVYQAIGDSFGLWTEQAGKTLQTQSKK